MDLDSGGGENMSAELMHLAVWSWASYLDSTSSHRMPMAIKQGNTWQTATIAPNRKWEPKNNSERPSRPMSVI